MGQTAEDLRFQLEQQREALGQDLVAIGDRVSPGRMVERRRSAIRQSLGRARNAVMGAADPATTRTGDGSATAAGRFQGTAPSEQSAVASAASSVGHTVSSAASAAADAVTAAPQAVQQQTQGNPLAAGLIAFGAGALAGSLLPASRREEQMVRRVQPALESAASEVGEQAQAVGKQAKQDATEAAQHLKEAARDTAEAVKAEAEHAADVVQSDAQAGVAAVKDDEPGRAPSLSSRPDQAT